MTVENVACYIRYVKRFLHALEIDQALLAHTPTGTGIPQKIFNRENLKFGSKFSVYTFNKFGTNGDIITNFYPDDVPRVRGYNLGTIFGRLAPVKFGRAKTRPKFFAISDNFRF